MNRYDCSNSRLRLMLIFTRGVSLDVWDRVGMLEREVELYRRLRPHLSGISFLTYGGESDLKYAEQLKGIDIVPNVAQYSPTKFSIFAPFLLRREFKKADILKTNQMDGAWMAVIAKVLYRKKAVVRCGFLWSEFKEWRFGKGFGTRLSFALERICFRLADACVVASKRDARIVRERYHVDAAKVRVIPNYVDTDCFRPLTNVQREKGLICFVGRLAPQKNVEMLFEACGSLKRIRLLIIGDGPLQDRLKLLAQRLDLDVEFHQKIPNSQLPQYLNRAHVFVLPSQYEGCPKSLLEAMACGLPVIGTDIEGIRDIIRHGENGILCEKSVDSIASAISRVLTDEAEADRMGEKAREYIVEHHSLERITQMETETILSLLKRKSGRREKEHAMDS